MLTTLYWRDHDLGRLA